MSMVMVLLAVTVGVTVLASVVIARHRAQAAADLAALSAAAWLASGHRIACARAVSVAASMRTTVTDCSIEGLDTVIVVAADVGVSGWRATALARAGPAAPGS